MKKKLIPVQLDAPMRRKSVRLSIDWDRVVAFNQTPGARKISRVKTDLDDSIGADHPGCIQIERLHHEFVTKSTYAGQWNSVGMSGIGFLKFPHGVEYDGNFHDGMFHGEGTLTYPMGQKLDGHWVKGRMVSYKFSFADALECDDPWQYCKMPDRRFYTSIQEGLRPAGRSLATNIHPPRKIPDGCYDTGDGFYNPGTKCITSAINPNKILRVPTAAEEKWIMENCRKAWDEPAGYRPDLFEHWVTGRSTDSVFSNSEENSSKSQSQLESSSSTASDNESINMIVSPNKIGFPESSCDTW